jgi:hypothetical protein
MENLQNSFHTVCVPRPPFCGSPTDARSLVSKGGTQAMIGVGHQSAKQLHDQAAAGDDVFERADGDGFAAVQRIDDLPAIGMTPLLAEQKRKTCAVVAVAL